MPNNSSVFLGIDIYHSYNGNSYQDIKLDGKFNINYETNTGSFTFSIPYAVSSGNATLSIGVFNTYYSMNIKDESSVFNLSSNLGLEIVSPNDSTVWKLGEEYPIKFNFIPKIEEPIGVWIRLYECKLGKAYIKEISYTTEREYIWKVELPEGVDSEAEGYSILVKTNLNNLEKYTKCFQIIDPKNIDKDANTSVNQKNNDRPGQASLGINIKNNSMYNSLKGKIMLKAEANGEAYYVHPISKKMHYLGRPNDAFAIMREQGIGITNVDLEKIPIGLGNLTGPDSDDDGLPDLFEDAIGTNKNNVDSDGDGYNDKTELSGSFDPNGSGKLNLNNHFSNLQKGKIFLQVERYGESWYVNQADGKRYFLGRPADAFQVMRNLGLGISNNDLIEFKFFDNNIILLPNQSFTDRRYQSGNIKFTKEGENILRANIDSDLKINELNENNNKLEKIITIAAAPEKRPDLSIVSIKLTSGDSSLLYWYIKNISVNDFSGSFEFKIEGLDSLSNMVMDTYIPLASNCAGGIIFKRFKITAISSRTV